jgi:hypothetical protein
MQRLRFTFLLYLTVSCQNVEGPSQGAPVDARRSDDAAVAIDASMALDAAPIVWSRSTCGEGGETGEWARINIGNSFYEVLAPEGSTSPLPLVVALHGDEGSSFAVKYHWETAWQEHQDFVVVLPQSPSQLVDPNEGWDNQPDVSAMFLWGVLEDVAARYDVDISRMYLTGLSAGGWFIGQRGFAFQHVFAAVQLSCGSSPVPYEYELPANARCKTAARFAVSEDDFLYDESLSMRDALVERGHEVEFVTTSCSGHCCGGPTPYARDAYDWFIQHSLCGVVRDSNSVCGQIGDIP